MVPLAIPEELVGLLLSDPALLDEELREFLRDLLGAVLDVGLDGLRARADRTDPGGRRHPRRGHPCRRAHPGKRSESGLLRALDRRVEVLYQVVSILARALVHLGQRPHLALPGAEPDHQSLRLVALVDGHYLALDRQGWPGGWGRHRRRLGPDPQLPDLVDQGRGQGAAHLLLNLELILSL